MLLKIQEIVTHAAPISYGLLWTSVLLYGYECALNSPVSEGQNFWIQPSHSWICFEYVKWVMETARGRNGLGTAMEWVDDLLLIPTPRFCWTGMLSYLWFLPRHWGLPAGCLASPTPVAVQQRLNDGVLEGYHQESRAASRVSRGRVYMKWVECVYSPRCWLSNLEFHCRSSWGSSSSLRATSYTDPCYQLFQT